MRISDITNEKSIDEVNNDLNNDLNILIKDLTDIKQHIPELIKVHGYEEAREMILLLTNKVPDPITHYYVFWYKTTAKLLNKYRNLKDQIENKINSGVNEGINLAQVKYDALQCI
jgi:hypothetical protein